MTAARILALDQGTSSSRSIVFDEAGRIVALAQRELRQIYPQPGWVEHDPREIWRTQLATAREALAAAGVAPAELRAIGIANQRETTLLWDRRSGAPLCNAVVWQDRRAEPFCAELRARGLEGSIRERTGLVVDAYFSGSKLKWLLDRVPGARAAAARGELAFGTVDAWLLWNLTGGAEEGDAAARRAAVHATDPTNASRTMLFDVRANDWSDELLGLFDVPRALLPRVLPSSCVRGQVAAALLGDAPAGSTVPVGGVGGRPAGRPVRPGLPARRAGEEHLRHRLLHADAHRRRVPPVGARAAGDQRGAALGRRRATPSRAASSSAARWCSGCATGCTPSRPAARCSASPRACPTPAA